MSNQIQLTGGAKVRSLEGVITGTSGVLSSVPLGAAGGVATLDSGGKVPVSQLPSSVVTYLGTWNAATNTPTLVNGTGDAGDMYICNVAGTVNFGAGPIPFAVGDWVLYGSGTWEKSNGQNGTVTSVAASITGNAVGLTGSPITTAGTLAFAFAGTNLQYVNGAGNLTTFPTLITSIGLSMPSAFSVANSPLTANGTIAVTGAGTTAQYIRGDGSLATFPTIATEAQRLITEVYNETGATLTKGTVVYINGGHGNLPTVTKAIATGDATSAQTYGIVQTDITDNNNGYVVVIGSLGDLDTQAYANGTQLYLSSTTAGAWTSTKQYAPAHLVYVGIVVRSHPTQGVVEVRIQNGFEMDELHNVSAQSPLNNQGLFYNTSTSLWENKSIATALGYTPANDALVVHLAGNETITGVKNFNLGLTLQDGYYPTPATGYVGLGSNGSGITILTKSGVTVYNNNLQFSNASNSYYFPNASGTISLTSDLANYVDLTTAQTIGGTKTFSDATKNNGGIFLQNASSSSLAGYMNIGGLTNGVKFTSGGGISNTFTLPSATGYTFTFPNATGTIALTSDLTGGTVTSVAALTIGTTGTDLSSSVANSTTTPVITLNVPTASATNRGALSSADWSTFNGKQAAINGTGFVKASGTTISYDNSTYLTTTAAGTTYVPYSGATSAVNLGSNEITASRVNIIVSGTNDSVLYFADGTYNAGVGLNYGTNPNHLVLYYNNITALKISTTGSAIFNNSVSVGTGITAQSSLFAQDVVGDPVYLRVRNLNTGGYSSSMAFSLYGYNTSAYYDVLTIRASYPGYGKVDFFVKGQSTSTSISALSIDATNGAAIFSSSVMASEKFEASFSNTNTTFDNSSYLRLVNTGASTLNQRVDLIMRWADGTYNGTGGISMVRESATGRSGKLILQPIGSDGNNISALTLLGTGEATFNGNVNITVASTPQILLTHSSTSKTFLMAVDGSNAFFRANSTNKILFQVAGGTTAMAISSGGNVGIGGVTSPQAKLEVGGSIMSSGSDAAAQANKGVLDFNTGNTRLISFGPNTSTQGGFQFLTLASNGTGNTAMTITTGGNVLIGTTTDATGKLQVNGTVYATGFYESSDIRFKNILETNPNINLSTIDVIKFTRKDNDTNQVRYGYSAQQVQSILPDAVTGSDFLNVNYLDVHTLKIAQLEQEIKDLKAKMN